MPLSQLRITTLFLLLILLVSCNDTADVMDKGVKGFSSLPSSTSGIDFINQVENQKDFNILTFRNYYNGGGVAIGDVNNDSLNDIYFTANMTKNKLFLNKGDMQFEDITEAAGVGGTRSWSTGVTFSDVNADGLLDIYVCNSGDLKGENIENELFINNGDQTFTELAQEYGLNDNGFSTHASFFDHDMDGDLDCFVLNNSYTDPNRIATEASRERNNYGAAGGDRLYENKNGKFLDITAEAGIFSGDIDFGLGLSVADINHDLYPDIYISNDFWERDYLYINNQDGTYKEVLTDNLDYVSANSMGADIADINNDGHQDIFSTDMLPATNYRMKSALKIEEYFLEDLKMKNSYFFQFIQNCLHVNKGDGTFQESAFFSGVAATDWSWGSLIFDMDNDGWKDIFVSNGIYHDITDLDFVDFLADEDELKKILKESGRVDFRDFAKYMPHNQQKNFAFINSKNLKFKNKNAALGLDQESYSNGSAYGDLDNDGDYDLVVNNVNMEAFVYQNNTDKNYIKLKLNGSEKNPRAIGSTVNVTNNGITQSNQVMEARGFQSSVDVDLIFGLGDVSQAESIEVIWPDGKKETLSNVPANQTIEVDYSKANGQYVEVSSSDKIFTEVSASHFRSVPAHKENRYIDFDHERLMPHMLSKEGPKLLHGDLNGDNKEDIVLLGSTGQATEVYFAKSQGYVLSQQPVMEIDKDGEDVCGALFDSDGDGDLDMLIGIGGNEYQRGAEYFTSRMYLNDGNGNFEREFINGPIAVGHIGCIKPCDFDNDGDIDVFIGGRSLPSAYGLTPRSFLFRNDGDGKWTDITDNDLGPIGMVTDAVWTDLNDDDWEDLIVVGEWMPITLYTNTGETLKRDVTIPVSSGWWNSINMADTDGDGDQDFVLGNWGENQKFCASIEKPLNLYISDYDENGRYDPIIEWYFGEDDKPYPFASKMDLTAQLPVLKKNGIKYSEYAQKGMTDMFSPAVLNQSVKKTVQTFKTSILKREGKQLVLTPMPDEAQMAPVFTSLVEDIDGDGIKDIVLGGNFYGLKPEVGRHDGFKGGYFKGQEKGEYEYVSEVESGLKFSGQVKDLAYINDKLLVARNNAQVLVFEKK